MCVFGKVIHLRVWKMRAGLPVVVEEITRGHSKSSCQVISRDKGDLPKSVCLVSLERLFIWESENGYLDAGSGGICHQRLLKVTNQGYLKR